MGQKVAFMKILLLGSNGQLGRELGRQLPEVGKVTALTRAELDITNHQEVWEAVKLNQPNIIINAAAYTAVDRAEAEVEYAYAINTDAVANLAQIANAERLWLIHFSSDYVFDGAKSGPYIETHPTNPINVYGASKLAGEKAISETNCQHLIFRTSWVIGKDGNNFAKTILRLASERDSLEIINDQIGVPTSPSLIAKVTIDAMNAIKQGSSWPQGIYHLAPQGKSNWHEIAQTLVVFAQQQLVPLHVHPADIDPIKTKEYPTAAKRPLNSQLDTQKLSEQLSFDLPYWKDEFLGVARGIIEELVEA